MSYIEFDKKELVNLEYSLSREILSTNRAGGYFSSTIVLCNTRKYHGLMVLPLEQFEGENHVLLSSVDETVIQHGKEFNLGIHGFPGIFEPRGHKYIIDFEHEPTPKITYRVGGVVLEKELLFVHNEEQIMVRYTLKDAHSPTLLRLKPFLAFRHIHTLTNANHVVNKHYREVENGVKFKLYPGFPYLHLQLNKRAEYVHVPDWFYNIEYKEELYRGYEGHEDLFVPGFFELPIRKGESVILSASTSEQKTSMLTRKYNAEILRRPPKDSLDDCLKNSASQFLVRKGKHIDLVAGYPWYSPRGRDTFLALPGLTLGLNDPKTCKLVLDSTASKIKESLFTDTDLSRSSYFNTADTPLCFAWAVQQYHSYTADTAEVWSSYGSKLKIILKAYREGIMQSIGMQPNGLIWVSEKGYAHSWMNTAINGIPLTPRNGYQVETNALWYNAVRFTCALARVAKDNRFAKEWEPVAERIAQSFREVFWNSDYGYLADFVDDKGRDMLVRPNQLFAISLPYSPLTDDMRRAVLDVVEQKLLTPRGIRTLAPMSPNYKGRYTGDRIARRLALHQGSAWPWLLGHFVGAYYNIHGKTANSIAKNVLESFCQDINKRGICSISEVYDGDPPQHPKGAISFALSVAEAIRVKRMFENNQ